MVKRRIILTESKLRRIIAKEVENLLRESKEIKSVTYKGQTLSIHKFEMSDPNDNEFIKSHKDVIWDIYSFGKMAIYEIFGDPDEAEEANEELDKLTKQIMEKKRKRNFNEYLEITILYIRSV